RSTGIRVVIDPRMAEKAMTPLTITLQGVPPETAVRLLANMVDLQAVRVDQVYYVTSKENAKTLLEPVTVKPQQQGLDGLEEFDHRLAAGDADRPASLVGHLGGVVDAETVIDGGGHVGRREDPAVGGISADAVRLAVALVCLDAAAGHEN